MSAWPGGGGPKNIGGRQGANRVTAHSHPEFDVGYRAGQATARAEVERLREALRQTVDLCNAMREHAPALNLAAEKQLRESLALLEITL